ncbi:MAG: FMN-binding protein [Bacteroidales bacterium]|nr:FMN-binding protein [Bacteroidales bacterium]MCF6342618.1 FMN-binding protein [Bacteroidales bacterium]
MVNNTFRLVFFILWILLSSFHPSGEGVQLPEKKMNKTVAKLWKDKVLVINEISKDVSIPCLGDSRLFAVLDQTITLAYIYVGRVNSCRSGGCSIDDGDKAIEFEYFDYFFVADTTGNILNVKVFNYRATHGHEIMSRGWLRQFVGYSGEEELLYGKDIEAISGATVSANAINDDLHLELNCLQEWLLDDGKVVQNGQVRNAGSAMAD